MVEILGSAEIDDTVRVEHYTEISGNVSLIGDFSLRQGSKVSSNGDLLVIGGVATLSGRSVVLSRLLDNSWYATGYLRGAGNTPDIWLQSNIDRLETRLSDQRSLLSLEPDEKLAVFRKHR